VKVSITFKVGGKQPSSWGRLQSALIPSPFTARFEFLEDHAVELDVVVQDGAPVCDAIRIERNPKRPSLTGAEFRRLPLRDWVNFAVGQVALMPQESTLGESAAWIPASEDEAWAITRAADRAPRRRKITDEHLRDVARVYRANVDDSPRDAVMETFAVKPAMASRYIKLARERGFLKPAPSPGKAGER
jgi:hypothetical protein